MRKIVQKRKGAFVVALMTAALATIMGACALNSEDPRHDGVGTSDETQAVGTGTTSNDLAATNAAILANPTGSGSYCSIVLDKIQPGQTQSRVLSYTCAESEVARDSLTASTTVLLMTWYKDANFSGSSTTINGCCGPCDAAGYGIQNVGSSWNDVISSFKSFNNCNRVRGYADINYGGTGATWQDLSGIGVTPALSVSFVGSTMNDRISSFLLNRQCSSGPC